MLFFVFSSASIARTEAEEKAPGAVNGSVQCGQSHKDTQDETFRRTGAIG